MLIIGPCSIESKSQAFRIAEFVQRQGATHFRGGAFKGQNRPIVTGKPEYLGLGEEGVKILAQVQDEFKFPCICDVQSKEQAYLVAKYNIKIMMVGTRNMDNLCLLRDIRYLYDTYNPKGQIILKRGPSATVDEWIGAAEHLGGEDRVVLCERGISSFDRTPQTRWRLDFVGVAYVKKYTNLINDFPAIQELIHWNVFTIEEFKEGVKAKGTLVYKEIVKNKRIIKGAELFYNIVAEVGTIEQD